MVAWEGLSVLPTFHTTAQSRRQSSARAVRGWFAVKACLVSLRGDRWVGGRPKGVFAISVSSALPGREVSLSLGGSFRFVSIGCFLVVVHRNAYITSSRSSRGASE